MKKESEIGKQVAAFIKRHPEKTWQQVAYELNISQSSVSRYAKLFDCARPVMHINYEALIK